MFPANAEPHFWGWFHILCFGVLIPAGVIRRSRRPPDLAAPLPARLPHFRASAATLVLLTLVSLCVARLEWIRLFPATLPSSTAILACIGFYVLAVIFMRPRWRQAVEKRHRLVHLFMAQTPAERWWWIIVSVLAGVGEEITWRGVLFALVSGATGHALVAAVLVSIAFGLAHAVQGWQAAVIIIGFALAFHALVWLASSLYIAMAVHIAYDITAGLTYGRLGKELGYSVDAAPAPPAK